MGGLPAMYAAYFDASSRLLEAMRPEVVGHFDLIRLHDRGYRQTLAAPEVWSRVLRNLERVREIGAVLDINARALLKGQLEPYVCEPVLDAAAAMGIPAAYGDDAHGVSDVGCGVAVVEELLATRKMQAVAVFPYAPARGEIARRPIEVGWNTQVRSNQMLYAAMHRWRKGSDPIAFPNIRHEHNEGQFLTEKSSSRQAHSGFAADMPEYVRQRDQK